MKKIEKLLPLGSLVLLRGGVQKVMVIGRGVIYVHPDTKEDVVSDYMAVAYPIGMSTEASIFFNQKDVDKILFTGFADEEEERFEEVYHEWHERLEREKLRQGLDANSFGF